MSIYKSEEQEQQQEHNTGTEETPVPLEFPPLTHKQLENCAFSSWYPNFRSITIKSKIIALPEEFINYLNADGVFIPGQSGVSMALSDSDSENDDEEEYKKSTLDKLNALKLETYRQANEANDSSSEDESDEEGEETPLPSFPALEREIQQTIDELGGEIFPKLNWSSPRDASWIAASNTLKCHNPGDVFLLLKSSDFIAHDLAHAYEDCSDEADGKTGLGIKTRPDTIELVLRKWFDLAPSMEFRCFGLQEELEQKIVEFYDSKIKGKYPDSDYTFDVYITRNRERIYLVDFNPFAQKTDSLLYEWEELIATQERIPLRLLASESAGRHMHQPFAFNRYPSDVTDLSNGQTVADFAKAFYTKYQEAK
ncbi:hypothetical protein BGZ76_006576 [Entomortierella beljakovae]|nr:hypothetical protein BGZ76_006576 [Entomortierella beljakovae]